jgi:hypothetical protein
VSVRDGSAVDVGGVGRTVPKRSTVGVLLGRLANLGDPQVVYVCGPVPGGDLRRWAWGLVGAGRRDLPAGWTHGKHYWPDGSGSPVLRYWRSGEGGGVEIHLASSWGWDHQVRPADGHRALGLLADELALHLRGAPIMGNPVLTGRYAMDRVVDSDRTVWDATTLEKIRQTSGQGRFEWVGPRDGDVPGLVELDLRLAYGALTRSLGGGPERWYGQHSFDPNAKARWDIEFRVPRGWDRPYGLLGVQNDDGLTWSWPNRPGPKTWATWADSTEVSIALAQGWPVTVYAGVGPTDPAADPLRRWGETMCRIALRFQAAGETLAYEAARMVIVAGIGGLQGRPQLVYGVLPAADDHLIPPAAVPGTARGEDGFVTWAELVESGAGDLCHPEWTARIWGKCRAALLWKHDGTGVLNLPADGPQPLGFRLDALYLTANPGWPDDGRQGRWRQKWARPGPARVHTLGQYDELKRRARG